jgi:glycerophosphoryl diester phosphodiesterase
VIITMQKIIPSLPESYTFRPVFDDASAPSLLRVVESKVEKRAQTLGQDQKTTARGLSNGLTLLKSAITRFGHRGTRFNFLNQPLVENTLPSIQFAVEKGLRHFEFDLMRTADNQLVVSHGDDILEILGLEGQTVGEFCLGHLTGLCYDGGIPLATFDDILAYSAQWNVEHPTDRISLNPELKGPKTVALALSSVERSKKIVGEGSPGIVFSSFSAENLSELASQPEGIGNATVSILIENQNTPVGKHSPDETRLGICDALKIKKSLEEMGVFHSVGLSQSLFQVQDNRETLKNSGISQVNIFSDDQKFARIDSIQNPFVLMDTVERSHGFAIAAFLDNPETIDLAIQMLNAIADGE